MEIGRNKCGIKHRDVVPLFIIMRKGQKTGRGDCVKIVPGGTQTDDERRDQNSARHTKTQRVASRCSATC